MFKDKSKKIETKENVNVFSGFGGKALDNDKEKSSEQLDEAELNTHKEKPRQIASDKVLNVEAMNELFGLSKPNEIMEEKTKQQPQNEQANGVKSISVDKLVPFSKHPFTLYEGERLNDMVDSIKQNGVIQPLIVRLRDNEVYEILAGHNRHNASTIAGLKEVPCIVKDNLTDEEALAYVVETNLIQRSFNELLHSEKASVLYIRHNELNNQEKRYSIMRELEKLQEINSLEIAIGECFSESGPIDHSVKTRDIVGDEYGLSGRTIARYLRVYELTKELKTRLDNNEFGVRAGVELSYLTHDEMTLVNKLLDTTSLKIDIEKAESIRYLSSRRTLTEEKAIQALNGTNYKKQKGRPKSNTFKLSKKFNEKLFRKYFDRSTPQVDIEDVLEEALVLYFNQKENDTSIKSVNDN